MWCYRATRKNPDQASLVRVFLFRANLALDQTIVLLGNNRPTLSIIKSRSILLLGRIDRLFITHVTQGCRGRGPETMIHPAATNSSGNFSVTMAVMGSSGGPRGRPGAVRGICSRVKRLNCAAGFGLRLAMSGFAFRGL